MSRREIQEKETLETLIPKYKEVKDQEKKIKESVTNLGSLIKDEFKNKKIEEFIVNGIRATVTITPKEDFNELQAIEILRKKLSPDQFNQIVKTKEYIDDDAFEKAVYQGKIDAAILKPATTPLEPTVTLRLGKAK